MIRKGYCDSRWGQVHYRELGDGALPPLICLHATAYSSRTFVPLMPSLGASRRVIALDTPGYGESDGPTAPVSFESYAQVIAEAVNQMVGDAPVDLLGYHTGALVATEIAASRAIDLGRLVLIGIPFFEGEERARWREKLIVRRELTDRLDEFSARWQYFITNRTPGLSLERAFECFVDELKAFPRDWWAHEALFDYRGGPRLAEVIQPTLVLNPQTSLGDASRRAARMMGRASVVEMPDLSGAIFDLGTARLATAIAGFLERP